MKYLPVVFGAVLSAVGMVLGDVVMELRELRLLVRGNDAWTYRVQQNEEKIDVLNRIHIHPTHKLRDAE